MDRLAKAVLWFLGVMAAVLLLEAVALSTVFAWRVLTR